MGKLNEKIPGLDMLTYIKNEDEYLKIFMVFFECLLKKMSPT